MNKFNHILINKNRGWRGLAEAIVRDDKRNEVLKMIFSFSQNVWNDLVVSHTIVLQDTDNYYVITFKDGVSCKLPSPTQQRSVLIKNYRGEIESVNKYAKAEWRSADAHDWKLITHFIKNKNNHTTSDWNCIGIRVIPTI